MPHKRFGEPLGVELEHGSTIKDLLEKMGIPQDQVFNILVDGRHQTFDNVLNEGERVSLFPPVGGG